MTSAALESLTAAIEGARAVPLTGQIRVEAEALTALIAQASSELPQAVSALERLRALVEAGRPIPLSDELRIDRRAALSLVKEARAAGRT